MLFVSLTIKTQAQGKDVGSLTDFVQDELIHRVTCLEDPKAELKAIQALFESHQLTSKHYTAWLYSIRAQTTYRSYNESQFDFMERYESLDSIRWAIVNDSIKNKMTLEVLADFQRSIDTCIACQPLNRLLRLKFLNSIGRKNDSLFIGDLQCVKKNGYKETRNGPGLSINFSRGKMDLLGLEVSAFAYTSPGYRLRSEFPEKGKKPILESAVSTAAKLFILGYNQNLQLPGTHDFTFSVFHFTAPILLDLSKIGIMFGTPYQKASWFYRPEIGLGWRCFSVGYGYNYVFSKSDRKQANTNLFLLKLSYPIVKYSESRGIFD